MGAKKQRRREKKAAKKRRKALKQARRAWREVRALLGNPYVATVLSGVVTGALYERDRRKQEDGRGTPLTNLEMWKDIAVNVLANILTNPVQPAGKDN